MRKILLVSVLAVVAIALTTNVWAQPYSPRIAADVYGTAQGGGNIAGIPTPKDDNDATPDINDAINLLLGTAFSHNSDVDFLQHTSTPDTTWQDISDGDNSGTFVLIGLTAANENTLGIYRTSAPGIHIPILGPNSGFGFAGAGTLADPFPAGFSTLDPGENFGFYLDSKKVSTGVTNTWDSDPFNNSDGLDHMLTYHLAGLRGTSYNIEVCDESGCEIILYTLNDPYLITWEDKPCIENDSGVITCGDEDYDDMIFLVDRVQPTPEPLSMALFGTGLAGLIGLRRKKAVSIKS